MYIVISKAFGPHALILFKHLCYRLTKSCQDERTLIGMRLDR